jgi:hypothetical protein
MALVVQTYFTINFEVLIPSEVVTLKIYTSEAKEVTSTFSIFFVDSIR